MNNKTDLSSLPYADWEQTSKTLHMYSQIVGKIRMALMPRKNHWWYLTLYLSPKGLTTRGIPYNEGHESFEITLNLINHRLELFSSTGGVEEFSLHDGLSVGEFYTTLFQLLGKLGVSVSIVDKPYDLPVKTPFSKITELASYQEDYIRRFHRIMLWVDGVFKEFSGRFYGKTCPVHLYWHHMDLAVTRFSGNRGPAPQEGASIPEKDAYSHENISFGFWAGDENMPAPSFYSYTFPSPAGIEKEPLSPASAGWFETNGSYTAMLSYDQVRQESNPRAVLLDFMESAYQAGAKLTGWDIKDLNVPSLETL